MGHSLPPTGGSTGELETERREESTTDVGDPSRDPAAGIPDGAPSETGDFLEYWMDSAGSSPPE